MRHSVEEITLSSGAKGLLIDIPGASVMNIKIQFRGGIRYAKTPAVYETAHVMEHLSFGANAKYKDEQAFETEFTKNGAYHNAWTSDFSICYEAECADFEWERILDLQRISITSPRFNEEELKSEKATVRAELTGYLNDYNRLVWPRLQKAIGEESLTFSERLKTISNIELKDIREHYRRTHTANNMRFCIAGKLRHRKRAIIRQLESWDLKPGERLSIPADELRSSDAVLIRRKDASNIVFGFSFVTPRRLNSNELQAMGCLDHILTGTTSSRVFGQARKRGLAYGIISSTVGSYHNTSWDFEGEVNEDNALELFDLIHTELSKVLRGDVSDKDIAAAKSYALGRYQMGAQTVNQISNYYINTYFLSGEFKKFDRIPDAIKSLDKTTIVALAREIIDSNINALVAVSSVEKPLITELATRLKI